MDDDTGIYLVGAWIVGVPAFLGGWIYAIASYGWFLGVGLGWIPALVIAALIAFMWPIILIGIGLLFVFEWFA